MHLYQSRLSHVIFITQLAFLKFLLTRNTHFLLLTVCCNCSLSLFSLHVYSCQTTVPYYTPAELFPLFFSNCDEYAREKACDWMASDEIVKWSVTVILSHLGSVKCSLLYLQDLTVNIQDKLGPVSNKPIWPKIRDIPVNMEQLASKQYTSRHLSFSYHCISYSLYNLLILGNRNPLLVPVIWPADCSLVTMQFEITSPNWIIMELHQRKWCDTCSSALVKYNSYNIS